MTARRQGRVDAAASGPGRLRFEALISGAKKVLEIGCGDGAHVPHLVRAFGIRSYVGLDIDADAIAKAQRTSASDQVRFLHASGLDESCIRDEYDIVFAHDVFAILDYPIKENLLANLYRHLAPRGAVIINEFNSRVLLGNAVANLFRWQPSRVAYFIRCYAAHIKARLKGLELPVVEPYRLADQAWYRALGGRLRAEIIWAGGEGLFLPWRNVPYFLRLAERVIPAQRDLVILRRPLRGQ